MVSLTILATGAALAPQAKAATFSDNFDAESLSLNYSNFDNWNITGGTVDVIGSSGFFDLLPGNGRYVDLDGSSGDAGVLTTKQVFNPGTYLLKFALAGSQRGDTNSVQVNFGSFSEIFTLASADPFQVFTRSITLSSAGALSFANAGGDNLGALLDNVSLENTTAIPTPALLPGLIGLGVAALRKRKGEAEEQEA